MTRIVVLSGAGRYADRWHDFAATSRCVATALEPLGATVAVLPTEPASLLRLGEADLLVVNSGTAGADETGAVPGGANGPEDEAELWARARAALAAYADSQRPLLALHIAANSFNDVPAWHRRLGVRWVSGRSMHPPFGLAEVAVDDTGHPVTAGLADFTVQDERYAHLVLSDRAQELTHHVHEGVRHPLLLVHEVEGRRTVYDALGHDTRSYDSPARVRLLRAAAQWALGRDPRG
ncbi:ThuA domain-containing protein [Streptomyces sp. CA-111067]|uniref:ThuA domain-containing protein n=1 Tax=Streptomyces sp. CA-111067 TaxID=3240046 RepID=UPI003D99CD36